MTDIVDELPDSMTGDTTQHPTSPIRERYCPTHPASDISALRQAVSAALGDDGHASHSHSRNPQSPLIYPPTLEATDPQHKSSEPASMDGTAFQRTQDGDSSASAGLSAQAPQLQLPHHHPEAPGTPWPETLSAPLVSEQSPAALITSDVIEDPQTVSARPVSPAPASKGTGGDSRWPSAIEMAPEALRDYLASMEIAKPKPRPRRKHLDRKLDLQKMKRELEDILVHRANLIKIEESSSAPPAMEGAADRILRIHGLPNPSYANGASNTDGGKNAEHSEAAKDPPRASSAQSSPPVQLQHHLCIKNGSSSASTIEDEILALNEDIEKLMVSISELDKIKDPQIELSFTGPKTKNLQRARPDDELWTDLTGRAPGIRRLSGFGTAYDTERTILTPAVSECSEMPTLSPMSSYSSLSIASSRSARSMRSSRSDVANRLASKVSIMQTLAEAEDSDQAHAQVTGYSADTDEGSQAVTAGSVSTDHESWQRDLERWARKSSPPPTSGWHDRTTTEAGSSVSPTPSSEARRRSAGERPLKERHLSSMSVSTTASSTISYLVRSNATSPAPQPVNESHGDMSDPHRLSLRIPHATQRGTPRKPPSSKRTRREHIVAGLQGDEWSGHRSLTAELRAATQSMHKPDQPAEEENGGSPRVVSPERQASPASNDIEQRAVITRTRSPPKGSTPIRLAAETLVESVAAAAENIGLTFRSSESEETDQEARADPVQHPLFVPRRQSDEASYTGLNARSPPREQMGDTSRNEDYAGHSERSSVASQREQQARASASLRPPTISKRSRRPKLTEAQVEQQRVKEAARQSKERDQAARWHQRHLAIDAKKLFQAKKDDLHNRLANTRNEDARAECQWELGELYASYAWGEACETPDGRDKPALGSAALTHALRVMYEALYSSSRREKGYVPQIALDGSKWARYAQLHIVMWSQNGGKTHFEWALRAFNEAIKNSGDKTEQAGNISAMAAQSIQAHAGSTPELLQRAITYWQRSTRCECSDNVRMAWRYVNLAHCYDILTVSSLARPDDESDTIMLRTLCIDAIEKAHSLEPTNASNAELLRYYKTCQEDESGSLEGSGENFDYDDNSSHGVSSRHGSPRQYALPAPKPNEGHSVEMIENTLQEAPQYDEEADRTVAESTAMDQHDLADDSYCQRVASGQESDLESDTTLTEQATHFAHGAVSPSQSPVSQASASSANGMAGQDVRSWSAAAPGLQHAASDQPLAVTGAVEPLHHRSNDGLAHSTTGHGDTADGRAVGIDRIPNTAAIADGDDAVWSEPPRSLPRLHSRGNLRSAPPQQTSQRRVVSEIEPLRASSASPTLPHQAQYPIMDSRFLLHTLQQYHDAIQNTSERLSAVEADLGSVREETAAIAGRLDGQMQEQHYPFYQQLQQSQQTQRRHEDELRAVRDALDRMSARFDDLDARQSGPTLTGSTLRHDRQPTRSPSPRSPRRTSQASTSTHQPRSRPTSILLEGDQRSRSVPPMQTGRSSVAGRSDDPPPSFHSTSDYLHRRRSGAEPPHDPYFGAGESFDTFDKQAIMERGAMLFGLYSLHQLARQTGLQTPLYPSRDSAHRP